MSAERAVSARAALEADYEIVRELGIGGTAIVYLARKRATGEDVAIKVIRAAFLEDEEALARFAREARYASRLDHPNIVSIREVLPIGNGGVALVMPYVSGRTLKQFIRDEGRLPVARAERVLRDIAVALSAAHALDIVHRDVKPENIFIDEAGDALLADFGLARSMSPGDTQLTMTGVAVGTPTYMPPEQIDGGTIDARGDVYSLGLVGWEMLSGKRPWDGDTLYALLYHQKHDYLPDVREMRRDVPDVLADVIAVAIEKEPAARWQSIGEMIAALDGVISMRPTDKRPDTSATVRFSRTAINRRTDDALADAPRRGTPARLQPVGTLAPSSEVDFAALAVELETNPRGTQPVSKRRYFAVLGVAAALAIAAYGWNAYQQQQVDPDAGARATAIANAVRNVIASDSSAVAASHAPAVSVDSLAALNARHFADSVAASRHLRRADSVGGRLALAPPLDAPAGIPLGSPRQSGVPAAVTENSGIAPRVARQHIVPPPPPAPLAIALPQPTSPTATSPSATPTRGSIAPGGLHTCFVAADGRAFCWGANTRGQLGSAASARVQIPAPVAPGLQLSSITSGLSHSCALAAGGEAWCWGENDRGQLGDHSVASHAAPGRVADGHVFRMLAAGAAHTCGLDVDGLAWCWGAGTRGQLGNGRVYDSNTPVVVSSIRFATIAAGWNFACGINIGGKAFCWGENGAGQLGIRDTVDRSLPAAVATEQTFASIAAGAFHTCAVTTDGAVYCWGRNTSGQLGDGTNTNRLTPALVIGDAQFTAITAGAMHTCGIDVNDVARCWGLNLYGQLGDGTNHNEASPIGVAGGHHFLSVRAFGSHTCGVTTTNEAMCWGYNLEGQLGDGTRTNRTRPVPLDIPVIK